MLIRLKLPQHHHHSYAIPFFAIYICHVPFVNVGRLWDGFTVVGAVPGVMYVVRMPNKQSPSIIEEQFEIGHLAGGVRSESVVLSLVGCYDVGKPN